jgi:hypothetical protein
VTQAGFAPDRTMADLLAAGTAANDALTQAAHRVLSHAEEDQAARDAAQTWLTHVGPAAFAAIPQTVIDHANHIGVIAAHLARDGGDASAFVASIERSARQQVNAAFAMDQNLQSFLAIVAAATEDAPRASSRERLYQTAERMRQLHILFLAAWKRVLNAAVAVSSEGLGGEESVQIQRTAESWRQLAELAARLQQSDLSLARMTERSPQ